MKTLTFYVNENITFLYPLFKKVGILILSSVIPFLISLGVKIASLKLDIWVEKLIKKYPKYKDAVIILSNTLKDNINKMDNCNQFIKNSEEQKSSKLLTIDDIKKEILPLISNEDDKKKVEDFLNLVGNDNFKEEIDECMKLNNIENMILEGLNININDIEDDDLRKKVIKYFKTFKKGKLDDEDLDDLKDADGEKKGDEEGKVKECVDLKDYLYESFK